MSAHNASKRCGQWRPHRLLWIVGFLVSPLVANARSTSPETCDPRHGAPAYFRFEEDCRALSHLPKNDPNRAGLQRLRYIALDPKATIALTLGGELRWRHELYDPPSFGLGERTRFDANEQRLLFHADLRSGGFRLFAQVDVAAEQGWPRARPFDHSAIDASQAFFEWSPDQGGSWLRIGRQEIDLPGNRLIGVNDPAGIRRAFDGVGTSLELRNWSAKVFVVQPVRNGPGAFDDVAQVGEHLLLGDVHYGLSHPHWPQFDLFGIRRERNTGVGALITGRDRRDTWGARLSGQTAFLAYAIQVDRQYGTVATRSVRANGVTLDLSHVWATIIGSPQLRLTAARASGDTHPGNGKIGSFDPLYPNLSYSTDAAYLFPSNLADASLSLAFRPAKSLRVEIGMYRAWRVHQADAVYQPPGTVLVPAGTGSAGRIADLPFVNFSASLGAYVVLSISAVRLLAGPVIRSVHGRGADYLLTQASFRF